MSEFYFTQAAVAAIIAVLLEVFPGLNKWWKPLVPKQKQVVILSVVAIIAVASAFVPCLQGACPDDPLAILNIIGGAFLAGLIGSQGVHAGTKYLTGG